MNTRLVVAGLNVVCMQHVWGEWGNDALKLLWMLLLCAKLATNIQLEPFILIAGLSSHIQFDYSRAFFIRARSHGMESIFTILDHRIKLPHALGHYLLHSYLPLTLFLGATSVAFISIRSINNIL